MMLVCEPWRVKQDDDGEMFAVVGAYKVAGSLPVEDAHLIAAAPDMEAALQAYVDACDNDECECCINAKAALAKARGKDQR